MTHIIDVRMHGDADSTPLQMISAERLAHLERMEALAKELVAVLGRGREVVERTRGLMSNPRPHAAGGDEGETRSP